VIWGWAMLARPALAAWRAPATAVDSYSVAGPLASLRKYLYAEANPISSFDPSGYFSITFGQRAHQVIQEEYERDHFDLRIKTGTTRGIFYKVFTKNIIKPDIVNFDQKTWAEIKPFSIYGITTGYQQMLAYSAVLVPLGFKPDLWPSKPQTAYIDGTFVTYFNAAGVIFYADPAQNAIELTALIALAGKYRFPINLTTLRQSYAVIRATVPRFVATARTADMQRVNALPGFTATAAFSSRF